VTSIETKYFEFFRNSSNNWAQYNMIHCLCLLTTQTSRWLDVSTDGWAE
jgi:hypothetical protein